jgi:transposase-like protein
MDHKKEVRMSRKRFKAEQIIGILREADVELSRGKNVEQICRDLSIAEQTYYRWRKEYGGMKVTQARRLKDLEKENTRLKRAVAELTLDKLILNEALEGNY